MTGQLADPRGAYDTADVCLGMGGSALRALAFAKPLVVQGEGGFFELLTPDSVHTFLEQGWYGVAERDPEDAAAHLSTVLATVLDDGDRRGQLGGYGRELVESRFSLTAAAAVQEEVYRQAMAGRAGALRTVTEGVSAARSVVGHKLRRRVQRLWTHVPLDDFNARPA